MQIDNKMSRFLSGPYNFLGIVFLITGLYALFYLLWLLACPLLFISWFLFGTYSGIQINTEQRIFREYNCWFGFIRTGQWKDIDNFVGLTLVSMNKVHQMYSQSNRANTSTRKEFRIYLVNKAKKPSVAIDTCKTQEHAQIKLDELAIWLKLPVFSIKK